MRLAEDRRVTKSQLWESTQLLLASYLTGVKSWAYMIYALNTRLAAKQ